MAGLARQLAGWATAVYLMATCLQVMAPIVAGRAPLPEPSHVCPAKMTIHGVGPDLRSYQRTLDRCSEEGMARR